MWYTRNDYITAPEVRLIDEAGKQLDVFKREDALAKPPVAKLIDFQKFLYQEEKKKKEAKKGIKKSATKDVQLSLFIGQNDLERQLNKAHEFIADGHQVRVKLALRGRELGKKTMAFDLLNKFLAQIPEGQVASEPKFQGRVLLAVVARKKKS